MYVGLKSVSKLVVVLSERVRGRGSHGRKAMAMRSLLLLLLAREEVPRPAVEIVGPLLAPLRRHRLVRVHVLERVRVPGRIVRLGAPAAVHPPLSVVVPAPRRVRKRVVGIVYELKFLWRNY